MKKKWSLVVAIVVIVLLVVAIVCTILFNNKDENKNGNDEIGNSGIESGDIQADIPESVKVSLNSESGETTKLGDFEVNNLIVKYEDGYTFVQGDIANNTDVDYPIGASLEITLYKDGSELIRFPVLTSSLNKGEKSTFESKLTIDCSDATEVKIDLIEH